MGQNINSHKKFIQPFSPQVAGHEKTQKLNRRQPDHLQTKWSGRYFFNHERHGTIRQKNGGQKNGGRGAIVP